MPVPERLRARAPVLAVLAALAALAGVLFSCTSERRPEAFAPPPPLRFQRRTVAADLPRLAGKASMNITLSLAPHPGAPPATAVQLLDSNAGLVVVTSLEGIAASHAYTTTLGYVPLRGGAQRVQILAHESIVAMGGRWDAAQRVDGTFVALFERATGGNNQIDLESSLSVPPVQLPPGIPDTAMTAPDMHGPPSPIDPRVLKGWVSWPLWEHFMGPRFVRGPGDGRLAVTVIKGDGPVLLSDVTTAEGIRPRPIGLRCADLILFAGPDGLTLVYKTQAGGGQDDGEGGVRVVRLDADLQPVSKPVSIFPGTAVLEIDATLLTDGIAIAATTAAGLSVALVGKRAAGFEVLARKDDRIEAKISSPSILAAGGKIHVALVAEGAVQVGEVAFGP